VLKLKINHRPKHEEVINVWRMTSLEYLPLHYKLLQVSSYRFQVANLQPETCQPIWPVFNNRWLKRTRNSL